MSSDPLLLAVMMVLPMVPTFWAIIDVPRRRFATTKRKVIWFLVVATFPLIGAMFYFLLARRHTQPM